MPAASSPSAWGPWAFLRPCLGAMAGAAVGVRKQSMGGGRRWPAWLLAALLVAAQAVLAEHEVHHGGHPDDHQGCELCIVGGDLKQGTTAAASPFPATPGPTGLATWRAAPPADLARPSCSARGPPTGIHPAVLPRVLCA